MKKLLIALLFLPAFAFAATPPQTAGQGGTGTSTWQTFSVPFFDGVRFTERNSDLKFNPTSNLFTVTNASTSNFSATTICFIGDTCRTTWPTGGGANTDKWATSTRHLSNTLRAIEHLPPVGVTIVRRVTRGVPQFPKDLAADHVPIGMAVDPDRLPHRLHTLLSCIIGGETIASLSGFGFRIIWYAESLQTVKMFAFIVFVILIALVLNATLSFAESRRTGEI